MNQSIEQQPSATESKQRSENAFNISITAGIIFLFLAGVAYVSNGMGFDNSVYLLLFSAAFCFLGTWMCARQKSQIGALLVIAGLISNVIGQAFVQKGLAIPTAIIHVILVSTIAIYTLPNRWVGIVTGASFFVSIIMIVIDQYTVGLRVSSSFLVEMYVALGLGAIYLVVIASRFPKFPLRTKLIVGFLFVSVVPLIVLGWQTYLTTQDIVRKQVQDSLSEGSTATSNSLDSFITEQFDNVQAEASLSDMQDYLSATPDEELEKRTLNDLKTFAAKNSNIVSCALISTDGRDLLDTVTLNINLSYKGQDFITQPQGTLKPYLSQVLFLKKFSTPIMYISTPVFNTDRQVVGVFLVTYRASVLQSILEAAAKNRLNKTEYTFLVDSTSFINLGHSARPDLLYKSYQNMSAATLSDLQSKNILPAGPSEKVLAPQQQIVDALGKMSDVASFELPSQYISQENQNETATADARRVPNTTWIVVSARPTSSIIALTQSQTGATITTSLIVIILTVIIALLASSLFTNPISQLTQVARKISAGDFTQKANIQSADEIGVLGHTFNTMASEIQELVGGLEKRVEQRTAELEKATAQTEKRASELQTIAEIARHISLEKDLENLLPLITRIVSEKFGFYHVGIFLLNENKKFAVLRAANSEGGARMLARGHKLEVGQTGIVGNVTATGFARIALDTGADAVYFNNPDLPETHSEMALPLLVRGEVIGALDVQSTLPNAFTTSDISILSVLADQISIAIDNARLLEESQKALAESQTVFREYVSQAWQRKSTSSVIGYHQTLTGGNVLTYKSAPEVENLLKEKSDGLAIPIKLRDQPIGTLNISFSKEGQSLTTEQVNIIQSVTERLGLALENARLFEETSTRASRERLVTEITTKIRGTNDPQEMIKTAMEELKSALGVSRVELVPQKPAPAQENK